jgi:hypothetical protein
VDFEQEVAEVAEREVFACPAESLPNSGVMKWKVARASVMGRDGWILNRR